MSTSPTEQSAKAVQPTSAAQSTNASRSTNAAHSTNTAQSASAAQSANAAPPAASQPPATQPITTSPAGRAGIDPRGPRFSAGVTAVLLLVVIFLALVGASVAALALLGVLAALFAWGAFAGVRAHPYGLFFAAVVRPRLQPPTELEDPAPPRFAQGVGLVVTGIGVILGLLGLTLAVPIAAAAAFIAAFLNSAFGYCLGCQIYLLLVRAGILGRTRPAVSSV